MEHRFAVDAILNRRIFFTTTLSKIVEELIMETVKTRNHKGRKRAIPEELAPVIRRLRDQGYGYRAIRRIMVDDHGLQLHWSRIRDFVKGRSCYSNPEYQEKIRVGDDRRLINLETFH